MSDSTPNERRAWMIESLVYAVFCGVGACFAVVYPDAAVAEVAFTVFFAWCSLACLARFVLDNLRDEGSRS